MEACVTFHFTEVGSETESNVDSEFGRTHFDDLVPSPTSEKAFLAQIHARKPGYIHSAAATGSLRSDMWVPAQFAFLISFFICWKQYFLSFSTISLPPKNAYIQVRTASWLDSNEHSKQ